MSQRAHPVVFDLMPARGRIAGGKFAHDGLCLQHKVA
jgi:hypothetical protein